MSETASGKCGENAYWEFDGVDTLTISGTGEMKNYGYYGFAAVELPPWWEYRGQIVTVNVSDGITSIGGFAFCNCRKLNNVTLPHSITEINYGAFGECSGLDNIILPDNITIIGDMAFSDCGISSIILPRNIERINLCTFAGCYNLRSIVLPNSVLDIGERAFWKCNKLESIALPENVTNIGKMAFSECEALSSIVLPKYMLAIGNLAFRDCYKLKKVIFTGNALQIDENIFDGDSLTTYYPANDATWTDDVKQNYGGTVTWKPYTNLADIEGDDNPEDSLEAALSTITLFPENGAEIGGTNGDITITLSTTGQLILNEDPSSYLMIQLLDRIDANNGITYTIYGNREVEIQMHGETWAVSLEEAGLNMNSTDNSLSLTMHRIYNKFEVNVSLYEGFLSINGKEIDTCDEKGQSILPWSFKISTDTYDTFSFRNYGVNYIPRKIHSKVFSPAIATLFSAYALAGLGKGGLCYGINLAEATFAWNNFPNLGLQDFKSTAKNNWDLKENDKSSKNEKENLTLHEYIQVCFMAQFLPDVSMEKEMNKSFGNDKNVENIEKLADSVNAFRHSSKMNPVMIDFTDTEGVKRHTVLAYDCFEAQDSTNICVIDSNKPEGIQVIKLIKKNGLYTGEWKYDDTYHSSAEKKNFISFDHPIKPFFNAYRVNTHKSAFYLLYINSGTRIPENSLLLPVDYASGNSNAVLDTGLYWILEETTIPFDIVDVGNISIAGNEVMVQYNNLQPGIATVSMKEDNFTFTTDQSGQKDAEISYLFYNENDIKKVTICEPQQDSSLEVYNKDEKIYFKGLNSAEIKTETGDYDETGDFIPDNTVVKTFSNLSEEEKYEVNGNEEIEHIVRVSDNVIIPESGSDDNDKPLQSIQLGEKDIILRKGESHILGVLYTPDDTTDDKTIVWTSSDETVATVDVNGKISALNPGKTVITALVGNASAVCNITVTKSEKPEETEKPVSTESPSKPTEKPVSTATPKPPVSTATPPQPTPTTEPETTQNPEQPEPTGTPASTETPEQPAPTAEPTQTPEQPEPTGTPVPTDTPSQPTPITGPKPTQTPEQPQPTATPASIDTPTQQKPLQSIAFEQQNITLQPEESCKLNIICNPVDTTDSRAADWTSSDESVASVNTEGTVTAHIEGTAQITAKIGENTAVCTVTVKASGQESGADGENTNNSQENNSNTGEQPAEGQQEISALSSPKTGESDNWMIYVILTGCVVTGLATISALLRRKQEK